MERPGILRLWSARLDGRTSHVDARIRDVLGPSAAQTTGLIAFYPARRGTDNDAGRVLATVWESEAAIEAAGRGLLAMADELFPDGPETSELALAVIPDAPSEEPPAILRVFRGIARDGHMEAYLEAVRLGTEADIAAGAGPLALFLAVVGPDRFVTVSAWASWRNLEIATGGNVHQPISTRNLDHLVSGTVTHYEILPGATTGNSRVPTAAG